MWAILAFQAFLLRKLIPLSFLAALLQPAVFLRCRDQNHTHYPKWGCTKLEEPPWGCSPFSWLSGCHGTLSWVFNRIVHGDSQQHFIEWWLPVVSSEPCKHDSDYSTNYSTQDIILMNAEARVSPFCPIPWLCYALLEFFTYSPALHQTNELAIWMQTWASQTHTFTPGCWWGCWAIPEWLLGFLLLLLFHPKKSHSWALTFPFHFQSTKGLFIQSMMT